MLKHKTWRTAQIAKLYYVDNLTQEVIAAQLQVSRSTISRALEDAKQQGIVEVKIHYPFQQVEELENALCLKFGLESARVLELSREWTYEDILEGLGLLAAQYFQKIIQPNTTIVITSGNSVYHTIKAVEPQKLDVNVIQIMGTTNCDDPMIDGPELAQLLVQRIGGSAVYMQAPIIIKDPEIYRKLYEEKPFQDTINRIKKASCALVGVGTVDPQTSSLLRIGFSKESLKELTRCGAVGEISAQTFNQSGEEVVSAKAQKALSIELKYIKEVPRVIGVAGGIAKLNAIHGALKGKLLDVLVTDQNVAEALIRA